MEKKFLTLSVFGHALILFFFAVLSLSGGVQSSLMSKPQFVAANAVVLSREPVQAKVLSREPVQAKGVSYAPSFSTLSWGASAKQKPVDKKTVFSSLEKEKEPAFLKKKIRSSSRPNKKKRKKSVQNEKNRSSENKEEQHRSRRLLKKKMMQQLSHEHHVVAREFYQENRVGYLRQQLDQSLSSLENVRAQQSSYLSRIRDRIYAQVFYPTHFPSDLVAVVEVMQRRNGQVISVRLLKTSGNTFYDKQIVDAIFRSSPLPVASQAELFQEKIALRFRPKKG